MSDPTNAQITRTLAKFMGWYLSPNQANWCVQDNGPGSGRPIRMAERWSPPTNRDDLAEVLGKLTIDQRRQLHERLGHYRGPCMMWDYNVWLLTCDPAIIARAVAEVVGK